MSNNSNDDDDGTSKHRNDEKENGKNDSDLASSGTEESFVTAKSNESSDDVSVTDTDSKKQNRDRPAAKKRNQTYSDSVARGRPKNSLGSDGDRNRTTSRTNRERGRSLDDNREHHREHIRRSERERSKRRRSRKSRRSASTSPSSESTSDRSDRSERHRSKRRKQRKSRSHDSYSRASTSPSRSAKSPTDRKRKRRNRSDEPKTRRRFSDRSRNQKRKSRRVSLRTSSAFPNSSGLQSPPNQIRIIQAVTETTRTGGNRNTNNSGPAPQQLFRDQSLAGYGRNILLSFGRLFSSITSPQTSPQRATNGTQTTRTLLSRNNTSEEKTNEELDAIAGSTPRLATPTRRSRQSERVRLPKHRLGLAADRNRNLTSTLSNIAQDVSRSILLPTVTVPPQVQPNVTIALGAPGLLQNVPVQFGVQRQGGEYEMQFRQGEQPARAQQPRANRATVTVPQVPPNVPVLLLGAPEVVQNVPVQFGVQRQGGEYEMQFQQGEQPAPAQQPLANPAAGIVHGPPLPPPPPPPHVAVAPPLLHVPIPLGHGGVVHNVLVAVGAVHQALVPVLVRAPAALNPVAIAHGPPPDKFLSQLESRHGVIC
jgi:hypothetical protein